MRWIPAVRGTLPAGAARGLLGGAGQRRLLRSSAGDRQEGGFLGGISTSLADALTFGRKSSRFAEKHGPTGDKHPFYPLGGVKLTYEDMVRKLQDKLELSNRLEAEALESKGKVHRHELLQQAQGYTLGVKESPIPGAGRGVFLTGGGFKAGEILTMYPGTVYTINTIMEIAARESLSEFGAPQEPLLPLFLIKNSYLLSEKQVLFPDGWHSVDLMVDGNPFHQSALRFLEERRNKQRADRSWLELTHDPHQEKEEYFEEILLSERGVGQALKKGFTHTDLGNRSMLSLGHLINHSEDAHVRMIFVPLPDDFPKDLIALAPTVNGQHNKASRWAVAAVAIRDLVEQGQEVYYDYRRNPKSLGWQVEI